MKNLPKIKRISKGATSQPLGARLSPDEKAEVEHYASRIRKSRAWFLRFLIVRGLEDYKRNPVSHK
jgi:hypothetical protein